MFSRGISGERFCKLTQLHALQTNTATLKFQYYDLHWIQSCFDRHFLHSFSNNFTHFMLNFQTLNGIGIWILQFSNSTIRGQKTKLIAKPTTKLLCRTFCEFMTDEKWEKANSAAKLKNHGKKREKTNFESRNKNVATFSSGYSSYSVVVALVIIMKCANIHTFEWLCFTVETQWGHATMYVFTEAVH